MAVVQDEREKPRVERLPTVPSYDVFAERYLRLNRPCVLPFELVKAWPIFPILERPPQDSSSRQDGGDLHPGFDELSRRYGQHRVPVVVQDGQSGRTERKEMLLASAVDLMRNTKEAPVYVKDWHLFRQERLRSHQPEPLYEPPGLFKDDWMGNLRNANDDDYAFCYAGSQGSSTGLHRDVYTSYSWSTNIIGRKRWRLFPPGYAHMLRRFPNVRTSELASSCDEMDGRQRGGRLGHVADGKYGWPLWAEARQHALEIIQEPGETIFVPSNWYHEVLNLTDCISINHNWCNAYNLTSMYDSMVEEVEDVEASLDDVRVMLRANAENSTEPWQREWTSIVQQVAREDAGWAWQGFWDMVEHNLTTPPTTDDLRRPDQEVRDLVRDLLARFDARPEAGWLGDDLVRCIARIMSICSSYCS